MTKPQLEFHTPTAEWHRPDNSAEGIWQQTLSVHPGTGDTTVLQKYEPGVDGSALGVIAHEYWEEVYILAGDHTDLTLGETFTAGMYACRPPGMRHGPYRSENGCTILVTIRHV